MNISERVAAGTFIGWLWTSLVDSLRIWAGTF